MDDISEYLNHASSPCADAGHLALLAAVCRLPPGDIVVMADGILDDLERVGHAVGVDRARVADQRRAVTVLLVVLASHDDAAPERLHALGRLVSRAQGVLGVRALVYLRMILRHDVFAPRARWQAERPDEVRDEAEPVSALEASILRWAMRRKPKT